MKYQCVFLKTVLLLMASRLLLSIIINISHLASYTWSSDVACVDPSICSVLAGYTGDRCDTMINLCESGPCYNGGTCNKELNGYRCTCPVGSYVICNIPMYSLNHRQSCNPYEHVNLIILVQK